MRTHVIWICVTIAALVVGMRMTKVETRIVEKPVEIVKTKEVVVEKPVEVIREVPKEVEKIVERTVEVPAKIPEQYENALIFMNEILDAKMVTAKEGLAHVRSVRVTIFLGDDIKKIVSESDIRTKFEITLRRSGISVDEKSRYSLSYSQEGFTRDNSPLLVYSFSADLNELTVAFRDDGSTIKRICSTWTHGNYGTVGVSKARDALISDAESTAEAFANDWLAKNSAK